MKKNIYLICFAMFLSVGIAAQTPIAYYPFNGNANDAIGALNGIVNGATLTTDRFGNANRAYSFDGVDDAISFATVPMTNPDNFTLMAWVSPAMFNPANQFNKMIISLGPGGNGYNMGMGNNSGAGGGNQLGGLYNLVAWLPSGSFFSTINTWYHVAMVRESGITKFYLNAVQAPNTFSSSPNAFTTAFQIGGQDFDPIHFWNGKIDEVKIYDVALTAVQVLAEFNNNSQSPIPITNMKLWMRGDEGITKNINNKISAWADQSVNNKVAIQPDVNKQPVWVSNVINGHAVVRYADVVEDILETNYRGPNTSEITIFIVAQGANISSPVRFQNNIANSTGFLIYGYAHFGAANGFCMTNDGGELNGINCGFFQNSQLHIGTGRWKANTMNGMQTFLDGNFLAQRNSNNSILPDDTLTIGSGNGSFGATDENTEGDIAEIIIYDRALTDAERILVENYLNIKYRVTNNLATSKPGSGNTLNFNGLNDGVEVPNSSTLQFPGDFLVECWVKIPASQNTTINPDNSILEKWEGNNAAIGYPFTLRLNNTTQSIYFNRYNGASSMGVDGVTTIYDNKWHHIAGTKNGTELSLYIDGILQGTATDFIDLSNVNNAQKLNIGSRGTIAVSPNPLTGAIDEVRIWNIGMTVSQIRDRMCHKITASDAFYSNLVAYFNFDESSGNTVFDRTINAYNGIFINNPARVTSGAPIGDASSHDYINVIKTSSLAHPTGESFTVTSTSGNPDAIHIYRVDEQPNTLAGATGVGNNNKYFGVFQVNGTSPQYTAMYNYDGNPDVNPGNENQLRLQRRTNNAATSWNGITAPPDELNNTITVTGESTEYILGKFSFPLPLDLFEFIAIKQQNSVLIKWKTAQEVNTSHFEVEKSNTGTVFTKIATVTSANSQGLHEYTMEDIRPYSGINFYRLKQVDKDGRITYSKIVRIMFNSNERLLTIYPNPATQFMQFDFSGNRKTVSINVYNAAGSQVMITSMTNQFPLQLNIEKLPKGRYIIQFSDGETIQSGGFIKQ